MTRYEDRGVAFLLGSLSVPIGVVGETGPVCHAGVTSQIGRGMDQHSPVGLV